MKKLYLCGAINGCSDAEAKDWREEVKAQLAGAYEFLDPMRRDYRGREDDCVAEIVAGDLQDIDQADALIVAATRPSWGTAMETFYASRAGKVVVIVCEAERVSPWLRHHATCLMSTLADAIRLLRAIA